MMKQRFEIIPTKLQGLSVLQRYPLMDHRGYLERMFCQEDLKTLVGNRSIVQINHTLTKEKGIVRGLHFQYPPHAEMKIVSCLKGEIFDVAVDIRHNSPTFLQWHGERLSEKAPFRITKLVTDNGKEFTDRFCATGERKPTNNHPFDKVCVQEHIEHRLITPRRPQTNGMVERFNGRIADVLKTTRFDSSKRLEETINHYVMLYNHEIPQKALGHEPPIQAMKTWYGKCPALFRKPVYNLTGHDI